MIAEMYFLGTELEVYDRKWTDKVVELNINCSPRRFGRLLRIQFG